MYKLEDKKYGGMLIWLCTFVYFVSYLTRINYGAVLVEIIADMGISKTTASLALTGSAITYGVGQLISGFLGDRIKPQYLITTGLLTTACMNLLLPFCSYQWMIAAWCINGLAQAMMWPPIVKIMTSYLTIDDYKRGSVKVSWGSSFGTIAIYLLAPVVINVSSWENVFFISAALAILMAVLLNVLFKKIVQHAVYVSSEPVYEQTKTEISHSSIPVFLMFLCIAPSIILQGVLRDGITTWMPSYISDVYHLGSAVSILTGVVLPIFSIISYQASSFLNRKIIKNELTCAGAIFALAFFASFLLSVCGNVHALVSVLLSAVITGCMHGINVILICMTPPYFAKYGKVSLLSGMLNSCTYIGAALSTYGMAIISESFGWNATIISWTLIAFSGALTCFLPSKLWNRFKNQP